MCATTIFWKDIQNTMVVTLREVVRKSFHSTILFQFQLFPLPLLTHPSEKVATLVLSVSRTTRVQRLQMVLPGTNEWFLALMAYWEALKTTTDIWSNPKDSDLIWGAAWTRSLQDSPGDSNMPLGVRTTSICHLNHSSMTTNDLMGCVTARIKHLDHVPSAAAPARQERGAQVMDIYMTRHSSLLCQLIAFTDFVALAD